VAIAGGGGQLTPPLKTEIINIDNNLATLRGNAAATSYCTKARVCPSSYSYSHIPKISYT
ncbi:hypothetical protein, partial [Spongiibacter sp.]|uniref:hypothetical protein n=1 Tax=Spongiibacter sp. TaxID=2024860 RepID=UPI00356AB9EB